jgi:hypothetical protein
MLDEFCNGTTSLDLRVLPGAELATEPADTWELGFAAELSVGWSEVCSEERLETMRKPAAIEATTVKEIACVRDIGLPIPPPHADGYEAPPWGSALAGSSISPERCGRSNESHF